MQENHSIFKDIAKHQYQLGEHIHNLATIDGTEEDFSKLTFAAEQLREDLHCIQKVDKVVLDTELSQALAEAFQQLENLDTEARAIQKLLPQGTSRFSIYRYAGSPHEYQTRMQAYDIHRKQLRVAENRLNEIVDILFDRLDTHSQHPFDQRIDHMHQQIEALIQRTDVQYRDRGARVLSSVRFLKANSEVMPEDWKKETRYIEIFTGRVDEEAVNENAHLYSCTREYVLGQLERLIEDLCELRHAVNLLVLSGYCLSQEEKDCYQRKHDAAYDAFFDPEREDLPRGFNDRVRSLSQQCAHYAGEDFEVIDRLINYKVAHFLQRLESVNTYFQNIENILTWMESHVDEELVDRNKDVYQVTRSHFLELTDCEQQMLLEDLVRAAQCSAGNPHDQTIEQKGFFPKEYLNKSTFREVLSLAGACVVVARNQGDFCGGAIGLFDEVPASSVPLQMRYAETIRPGVNWWMNIMPEARGTGIYDILNDELLLAAIGKVDVMVGRIKLGEAPSTHALRAHVKRLHIPSGGFEQLPYGLHAHLIHFVSPQLRTLYFNYLNIDQGQFEADPIVQAQCAYARQLQDGDGRELEGGTRRLQESTLVDMLFEQSTEPLHYSFKADHYFHMLLVHGNPSAAEHGEF